MCKDLTASKLCWMHICEGCHRSPIFPALLMLVASFVDVHLAFFTVEVMSLVVGFLKVWYLLMLVNSLT